MTVDHYRRTSVHTTSSQSTERLLYDYLRVQIEKSEQQNEECYEEIYTESQALYRECLDPPRSFPTSMWDDTFLSLEEEEEPNIILELNTFSDLLVALKDIEEIEPYHPTTALRARAAQHRKSLQWPTTEDDLVNLSSSELAPIPPSIRLNIENSQMLDVLMDRAVKHWCCIGFKVAPISVDLIKNWQRTPKAIVYCVASISLVTLRDERCADNQLYPKQAAMVFYEQARNKLDDILFDDMQPLIIQSYFCLSYTSNLLRLYEQQRTWGGLASISLQHLATNARSLSKPMDELTLGCYLRWYYVDAWMCLTLNRDCLLPDDIPWVDMNQIERLSLTKPESRQRDIYRFANLTRYMRRYIRALYSGKLFETPLMQQQQSKRPSALYYEITESLTRWYNQLPQYNTMSELHLHLCYNSMRLLVLYQFLHPQYPPTDDILLDCLQTNLELLRALQHLRMLGCDQSTYHHMFFAIHNTAKRTFNYGPHLHHGKFRAFAEEQLKINLMLLKSTQAYAHDVFKMKIYAQKIQDQFIRMKISINPLPPSHHVGGNTFVFKHRPSHVPLFTPPKPLMPAHSSFFAQLSHCSSSVAPSIIVFRQGDYSSSSKSKKRAKKEKPSVMV
ncbi:MAG: hypothetical protein EXX96DRAFT_547505 [Benjaminiella poitrasii]|nr:MAG: hypothetical protein EXX96DRAFT_547505 [Benjaminiella poitrasii]